MNAKKKSKEKNTRRSKLEGTTKRVYKIQVTEEKNKRKKEEIGIEEKKKRGKRQKK